MWAAFFLMPMVVVSACIDGTGLNLATLPKPGRDSLTAFFSTSVTATDRQIPAGSVLHADIVPQRIPHLMEYSHDGLTILFVVSGLFDVGPVETDGSVVNVRLTDGEGTIFNPVNPCVIEVVSAYTLGMPTEMLVETVCPLGSSAGARVTMTARDRRFLANGGASGSVRRLILDSFPRDVGQLPHQRF